MKYILSIMLCLAAYSTQCMEPEQLPPFPDEFIAIQKMYEIAQNVANKARKEGDMNVLQMGETSWPEPYPQFDQTQQGMYLCIDSYPNSLGTPYGNVKIYGGASYKNDGNAKLTLELMKHLTLKFLYNTCENSNTKKEFYTYTIDRGEQKIKQEDLEKLRGSSELVLANLCECKSIYEIAAIEGMPLPQLMMHTQNSDLKSYEQVKKEWAASEHRYQKENGK